MLCYGSNAACLLSQNDLLVLFTGGCNVIAKIRQTYIYLSNRLLRGGHKRCCICKLEISSHSDVNGVILHIRMLTWKPQWRCSKAVSSGLLLPESPRMLHVVLQASWYALCSDSDLCAAKSTDHSQSSHLVPYYKKVFFCFFEFLCCLLYLHPQSPKPTDPW